MTRFARAKGSKSSNERLPNEATPWDVMKQQLEQSQAAKNFSKEKTKSAKQLLKDKEESFYYDSIGNVNNEWATFDDEETKEKSKKKKITSDELEIGAQQFNNKKENLDLDEKKSIGNVNNEWAPFDNEETEEKSKKKKRKKIDELEIGAQQFNKKKKNLVLDEKKSKTNSNSKNGEGMRKESNSDLQIGKKSKKSKLNSETSDESKKNSNSKISQFSDESKNDNEINGESSLDLQISKPVAKKSKKSKLNSETSDESKKNSNSEISLLPEELKIDSEINTETKSDLQIAEPSGKKSRKSNKTADESLSNSNSKIVKENPEKPQEKLSKRQKRNQKKKNKNSETPEIKIDATGFNVEGNDWSSEVKFGKKKKQRNPSEIDNQNQREVEDKKKGLKRKQEKVEENSRNVKPRISHVENVDNLNEENRKRKVAKIRDNAEHKRRKPDPGVVKMFINGMEIEVVQYDGFPVKKEDAERLKELKQNMIIKGIPMSEVKAAMKLERRKAEKSLARERKKVCFHCRKSGHNLSDCPELGRDEAGCGICFKCGSAEHTHFECKVNKKEEFRFASCFICREQGHIAKQCPDNPKGLYPKGGACKICGDVTHLRKDCPDVIRDKEEATITLEKIEGDKLESLEEDVLGKNSERQSEKRRQKIVRF